MITFADRDELDAYVRRAIGAAIQEHVSFTAKSLDQAMVEAKIPPAAALTIRQFVAVNNGLLLASAMHAPLPKVDP